MISHAKNFIFVHVPKTAGNSLQNALFPYSEDERTIDPESYQDGVERFGVAHPGSNLKKHSGISAYQQAVSPEFLESAFKFTVLRNPWDRMISQYFFRRQKLAGFVNAPDERDLPLDEEIFRKQLNKQVGYRQYICARNADGRLRQIEEHAIDFFVRFEHLQDDMDVVADKLGIARTQLVQRNATRHRPYASYYTESLHSAVAEHFATEIAYFGFKLDL